MVTIAIKRARAAAIIPYTVTRVKRLSTTHSKTLSRSLYLNAKGSNSFDCANAEFPSTGSSRADQPHSNLLKTFYLYMYYQSQ